MEIVGVYAIINTINNKIYIGRSIDIEARIKVHFFNNFKLQDFLHRSIRKYGVKNFKWYIVELIERDSIKKLNTELNNREKYYIKKFKTFGKEGYNLTKGGEGTIGYKYSEEEIIKNSERNKLRFKNKENHPMFGKHHSEESKEKNRQAHLGKKQSEETKQKRSKALMGRKGVLHTEIWKQEHSKRMQGKNNPMYENHKLAGKNNPNAIKVICLNTLEVFDYIKQVTEKYNIDSSDITKCCKGKLKSCGKDINGNKLHWMYYDEYLRLKE